MRSWWRGFQPIDGLDEAVVGADETLDATVDRLLHESWAAT